MHTHRIGPDEPELIRELLAIHDRIPLAWDPNHRTAPTFLDDLLERLRADAARTGLWALFDGPGSVPEHMVGILWATLRTEPSGIRPCAINTLWIRPELRGNALAAQLTEPCLAWAREQGAARLDCTTHIGNARMREILDKHGFRPTMIQYTLPLEPSPT